MIAPSDATTLADSAERSSLMAEYAIGFDGRRYKVGVHRYDQLADAVAYARILRARSPMSAPAAPQPDLPPSMPTDADRQLMGELGIGFRQGSYEFGGSRYELLGDAVHYAQLLRTPRA